MIELFAYAATAILALLFAFKVRMNDQVFFVTWCTWALFLSWVIRYSGFDVDTAVYAKNFKYSYVNFFVLREPVFWIGSRYVYNVVGNPIATFMVFDFLSFLAIAVALRAINAPRYYYFLMFLLPFMFFGMQNIYRQYLSMSLLLMAYALNASRINKLALAAVSLFTHNAAAVVVAPLFWSRAWYTLMALFAITIIAALRVLDVGKSGRGTGSDLRYLFTVIILAAAWLKLMLNRHDKYSNFFVFSAIMFPLGAFTLESSQVERIGYYILFIMAPIIIMDLDAKVKQVVPLRLAIISLSTVVIVGFPATWVFLT